MPQCKSGESRNCIGNISHNHFGGLCSNCADLRDRGAKKKSDLTNEDWREGLKATNPDMEDTLETYFPRVR